jgi:hypothetical protein
MYRVRTPGAEPTARGNDLDLRELVVGHRPLQDRAGGGNRLEGHDPSRDPTSFAAQPA